MIEVHYVGHGTRQAKFSEAVKKLCINNDDPKENGYFYLPPEYAEMLEIHGTADVSYLFFENRTDFKALRLNITDQNDNPAPIEIKKGQERCSQNGNKLKIIFDDVPPVEPPVNQNKSDILTAVNHASIRFWNNADRNDISTWTANKVVIDWLTKERGFTENIAKAAATIVRPEWAKK